MAYVTMRVEADIDMSDFDDDDLIEELKSRGYYVESSAVPDDSGDLMRLLELFKIKSPDAVEQTKIYLQDRTGKIL